MKAQLSTHTVLAVLTVGFVSLTCTGCLEADAQGVEDIGADSQAQEDWDVRCLLEDQSQSKSFTWAKFTSDKGWHQRPDFQKNGYPDIMNFVNATSSSEKSPFALRYQTSASDEGVQVTPTRKTGSVSATQLSVVVPNKTLTLASADGPSGKWKMIASATEFVNFITGLEQGQKSSTHLFQLMYVDAK